MKKYLLRWALVLLLLIPAKEAAAYTVVFMGDSITDLWLTYHSNQFFVPNNYLGEGISGQTTAQMIARFQSDVLAFKPKVVVIMGGTNDVARNQGYVPFERIVDNLLYMAQIAKEAGAEVALLSIPPAASFWWNTAMRPATLIRRTNLILQQRALEAGYHWIDLYPALVSEGGSIDEALSDDEIHPVTAGYELIEQILQPYLEELL